MSNKDFQWDDKTVAEFAAKFLEERINFAVLHDYAAAPAPLQTQLEQFKASKQPQPTNKNWEIVAYEHRRGDGEIWELKDDGLYHWGVHKFTENAMIENKNPIHSVRRISDNQVFTVGGRFLATVRLGDKEFVIKGFEIYKGVMSVIGKEADGYDGIEDSFPLDWVIPSPAASSPSSKRNWEIVALKEESGNIYSKPNDPPEYWFYIVQAVVNGASKKTIHAVRRLSDGIVFSVGDEVLTYDNKKETITGFEVSVTERNIEVQFLNGKDYNWLWQISKPSPAASPSSEQPAKYTIGIDPYRKDDTVLQAKVVFKESEDGEWTTTDGRRGKFVWAEDIKFEYPPMPKSWTPMTDLKTEQSKKERIEVTVVNNGYCGEMVKIRPNRSDWKIPVEKNAAIKEAIEQVLNYEWENSHEIKRLKDTEKSWAEVVEVLYKLGLEEYKWQYPISPVRRILNFIKESLFTAAQLEEAEKAAWDGARLGMKQTDLRNIFHGKYYPTFEDYKRSKDAEAKKDKNRE